jgi:hypothetical protein
MAFRMLRGTVGLLVLLTLSFWCLSANSSDTGNNYRRSFVEEVPIARRTEMNATPLVTVLGIRGSRSDTIHPRLEIRELERRSDEFNVFLLGLQRFQSVSQDNMLSYFQVAGNDLPSTSRPYLRHSNSLTMSRYPRSTFRFMGRCRSPPTELTGVLQAQL